jgi:DNA modification methylase
MPAAKKLFRNKLNNLQPKDWLKFQKSWFVHNPPPRRKDVLQHPAKFPETLAQEFIEFFTKKGQTVLDPMVGTGSTLVACLRAKRSGIGIELNSQYAAIAKQIVADEAKLLDARTAKRIHVEVIQGDAAEKIKTIHGPVDYVLTCYDDQTEILTEDGWVLFAQLREGMKVATLEEGRFLRYRKPERIIKAPYDGPMYHIQTRTIDLVVTPNHNMYVRKRRSKAGFQLIPACQIVGKEMEYKVDAEWEGKERPNFCLPGVLVQWQDRNRTKEYPAREISMDAWLEFLGYWLTEGSVSPQRYSVDLTTADSSLAERFMCVIRAIGDTPKLYQNERVFHVKFNSPVISTWLAPLGHADQKYIPREFLRLSRGQLQILFEAMMAGDGDKVNGRRFWTSSVRLKDDFQELLLKIGYAGICQARDRRGQSHTGPQGQVIRNNFPAWCVGIWKKRLTPRVSPEYCSKTNPYTQVREETIHYQGTVYCVRVPSGIIYVRRNGKGVWSGNSPPYWDMLRARGAETQKKRRTTPGLDVFYSDDPRDLGNLADYDEFVERLAQIYEALYPALKDKAYLTIIVKNVKKGGKIYPLAWDLAKRLSRTYTLKDERIWAQDNQRLAPYGLGNAWVSNTFHHYCLQLRKE